MEEFSLFKYTVYLTYLHELKQIKWYQFKKRKALNIWLDKKIEKATALQH